MPEASLDCDTEELAHDYELVSAERQFKAGQQLVQLLQIRPHECVLDIGCGTGRLVEYAAALVGPDGSVTGIDPLPLRIKIAQKRSRPNLSFSVGGVDDLTRFSPDAFDVACMNAVFHWLADQPGALRQVRRVLKKGGRLGIATGDKDSPNTLQAVRARVLSQPPFDQYPAAAQPVARRVSVAEIEQLLSGAGFKIERLETSSNARPELSPDAAIRFSEASSFGNFLGHLPAELRGRARDEIVRELERTGELAGVGASRRRIFAIAIKT